MTQGKAHHWPPLPALSQKFFKAIRHLAAVANFDTGDTPYYKLIDDFGTHSILKINMGARTAYMSTISEAAYNNLVQQKIDVKAAANAYWDGISGNTSAQTEEQKAMAKAFSATNFTHEEYTIGTRVISTSSNITWAKQAALDPMPLQYTLLPLDEVAHSYLRVFIICMRTKFLFNV